MPFKASHLGWNFVPVAVLAFSLPTPSQAAGGMSFYRQPCGAVNLEPISIRRDLQCQAIINDNLSLPVGWKVTTGLTIRPGLNLTSAPRASLIPAGFRLATRRSLTQLPTSVEALPTR